MNLLLANENNNQFLVLSIVTEAQLYKTDFDLYDDMELLECVLEKLLF